MPIYAYRGNASFIDAITPRLLDAGFEREGEIELAEYVLTFCTNMSELEDVYFGDEGLIECAPAGCVLVDISAATPNFAMEMSAVATVSGLKMVCAPMLVRNKAKEDVFTKSNLSCFAGCDEDGEFSARELLEAVFGDVREVSNAGAAQMARAANTIQNTAEMVSAIEVLSLFRSCRKANAEIDLRKIAPDATSPEAYFVMCAVRGQRYQGDYTVEMLMSEISAAIATADDYDLILPQTEAAFHLYELLAVIGGADMSPVSLSLVYEGDTRSEDGGDSHGLDWGRAEVLYGDNGHSDEDVDSILGDGDESDFMDFGYDDNMDGDDAFRSGYGYSIN